jgi:hypothetical protein
MSQIFKKLYPLDKLEEFLNLHCYHNDNYFLFTINSYKQYVYNNEIKPLLDDLNDYFFDSKKKYLTRKINFKQFMTIIRQICKSHHSPFISKIKYNKSTYQTDYYIYLTL